MGYYLFQNLAVLASFLVFFNAWIRGEKIDMAQSVSTLALIFYLFVTINQLCYIAVFQLGNFAAILNRISSVL